MTHPHHHINVTLTKPAFVSMVTACIEVYKREAIGIMLGEKHRKHYLITEALPYQTAKRGYEGVQVSAVRLWRINYVLGHVTRSRVLGFFHSHPEFPAHLSGLDREEHIQEQLPLQFLLLVKRSRKRRKWKFYADYSVSGTIGRRFFVKMMAFEYDKRRKSICPLKIVIPFLRSLNVIETLHR